MTDKNQDQEEARATGGAAAGALARTIETLDKKWCKEGGPNGKYIPPISEVEDAIRVLLYHIGENPNRDGLRDTPARVARALLEMTQGYKEDPAKILGTIFKQDYDEVIISRGIPFTSLCEHHILPFQGTVDIGYIPSGKGVVGLSKLARLVDCFARRLQIQEGMTKSIAESLQTYLEAKGVAVVVRAEHSCQSCRGVEKSGCEMVTSVCLGVFRDNPAARAEFLALTR